MSMTRLALIQMRCDREPAENLRLALDRVGEAARAGAHLVVLPELFLGPYFCQSLADHAAFGRAEPVPGPTTQTLAEAAAKNRITLVGGSIFEKAPDGKYYNTASVFLPDGSVAGHYRKMHIPEDILYHEQHYFAPGDIGVQVFDTPAGKIAPLICYDQWYPEAARLATLQGAEFLLYPTAIGLIDESVETNITGDWEQMWRNAQVGHAAVNNVYVAAVNRVGKEGAIHFWGGSFVASPAGHVLIKAGSSEEILYADCDRSRVPALQSAWRFLVNRRPEMYRRLTSS